MDKSPWELDVAARPRLLRCLLDPDAQEAKKGEDQEADRDKDEPKMRDIAWHFRGDLQPVSRFTEKELMGHWKGLQMLELEKDKDKEKGEGKDEGKGKGKEKATGNSVTAELGTATAGDTVHRPTRSQSSGSGTGPAEPTDKPPPPPSVDIDSFYNAITRPPVPLPLDPADLRQQSLKIIRITTDALDNPLFDRLWAKGEPIVVDGLLEKFKTSWIPEEMIARFGNQKCGELSPFTAWSWVAVRGNRLMWQISINVGQKARRGARRSRSSLRSTRTRIDGIPRISGV